jgi:hypothetical protein
LPLSYKKEIILSAGTAEGGLLETYILHIYRRSKSIPHRLVGIVEKTGTEGKRAFTCFDELWQILNQRRDRATARESPRGTGRDSKETKKGL